MLGKYRPASEINPNWYVSIKGQTGTWRWCKVQAAIETDGEQGPRVHFIGDDGATLAIAAKGDDVRSLTPDEAARGGI
jgi:hypothetical protein